jgi:hypothetical protein
MIAFELIIVTMAVVFVAISALIIHDKIDKGNDDE